MRHRGRLSSPDSAEPGGSSREASGTGREPPPGGAVTGASLPPGTGAGGAELGAEALGEPRQAGQRWPAGLAVVEPTRHYTHRLIFIFLCRATEGAAGAVGPRGRGRAASKGGTWGRGAAGRLPRGLAVGCPVGYPATPSLPGGPGRRGPAEPRRALSAANAAPLRYYKGWGGRNGPGSSDITTRQSSSTAGRGGHHLAGRGARPANRKESLPPLGLAAPADQTATCKWSGSAQPRPARMVLLGVAALPRPALLGARRLTGLKDQGGMETTQRQPSGCLSRSLIKTLERPYAALRPPRARAE